MREVSVTPLPTINLEAQRQRRSATIVLYASIQFTLLTIVAMFVYPGGAVYELTSNRYLFLGNFFSDLGATVTPSGRNNLLSHILFLVALSCVGLALIQFASIWKIFVARNQKAKPIGITSQAIAIITGVGFIGIAATPWDRVLDAHNAFVQLAFGFLFLYILCLFLLQLRNDWPLLYTALNAIHVVLLLIYFIILVAGPRLDTQSSLEFQVAAQKIIVYASILNLGLQAFAIRRAAHLSGTLGMKQ